MKRIQLRGKRRSIEAFRDTHGIPHVRAGNWYDALYGLGFMHAVDRGTQLLFARCIASGCASERISASPELMETDRFFRRIGLHVDLETEVRAIEDHLFDQMTYYCEGVNDGIKSSGRSLPMWATGFQPQPWNQQSVMLIGKLLSFGGLAISQLQNERLIVELIHAGVDEQAMRELFGDRLNHVDFEVLRRIKMSNQLSDEAMEVMVDLPRLAGSNAWAVAPSKSATGHALLASDPHLEVNRLPAIWYEAVLEWPGQYLMGATLPGCPLFAVARTPNLAWGVTYMKGDTIDYFVEDVRRGGETGWQYRRAAQWCDFECRVETIATKGQEPAQVPIYSNDQGILDGDPEELGEGCHLSINWTGRYPGNGRAIATWLEVIQSKSAAEAMKYASRCVQPTLCWIFADGDGHIGMQTCGRFPIRGGNQIGLAPIPAWDETNHWQGFLPISKLPSWYDPPEGYVATANEEINPDDCPILVTQPVPRYRKRRIDERLAELPSVSLTDMRKLQYDLISLQARDLLSIFLPYLEDGPVKQRLTAWDHRYHAESRDAPLFLKLYKNVIVQLLGHEQGIGWRRMLYLCSRAGYSVMILTAADRLLAREHSLWWKGRDKGELIRRAAESLADQPDQTWSEINSFHFTDRFFGNHQVGRMLGYNSRRYAMPGNHATPFQGHVLQTAKRESTFAPSYHFVTDLGKDEIWTNLPGGPSENRFSRLYKNDVSRWLRGDYKRVTGIGDQVD